jgi:hypothetical protein
MTKTLTILIASTALTALIGLPAWSAMRAPADSAAAATATGFLQSANDSVRLMLVDDDEDEDEGRSARSESDDDHGKCGDDDDEDEDEDSCNSTGNPPPAGSTTPPKNGLFGDGAAPKVQAN